MQKFKVVVGADHGGFEYKKAVIDFLKSKNIDYIDVGSAAGKAAAEIIGGKSASDIEVALTELKEVQLNIKDLSQREKELRDQVLGFMGSAAKLTANGKCLATYTMCKGRESFNSKRFSLEYPELYASYMEQGPSYRRFVIKK